VAAAPGALRERRIDVGFGIGVAASDFAPTLDAVWARGRDVELRPAPGRHPLARREPCRSPSCATWPARRPGRDVNPCCTTTW
jgi:hypothetical protein